MGSKKLNALTEIKKCIEGGNNFVLQGGAGSGKTETLKRTIEFISQIYPGKKIACITHTNAAVDEIKERLKNNECLVSTVHSFLNEIIKDYKKNIHDVIHELFQLNLIDATKKDHKEYKKLYEKYDKEFSRIEGGKTPKVEGKKVYDTNSLVLNSNLNEKINDLNSAILKGIKERSYDKVRYSDTSFNSFSDLTFGHDGLIDISSILFAKYPAICKILQDKFDFILIDEYQDTDQKVIEIFLEKIPDKKKTIVGLFGDSMQSIYSSGVGNVVKYIDSGTLTEINKEDNYRCSEQVIGFINPLRNDKIKQKVVFKNKSDGSLESSDERQGAVQFYYAIYNGKKPHSRSTKEEKDKYTESLSSLISKAMEGGVDFKILQLTNKQIARECGFENLHNIFSARFLDSKEKIDKELKKLQIDELFDLCDAYKISNYNLVISKLKKQGFVLRGAKDKIKIKDNFDSIINSDLNSTEALNKAFELKLLKKSEKYSKYIERKDFYLEELKSDVNFQEFKEFYNKGENTLLRISNSLPSLDEYDFKDLKSRLEKESFYQDLFSDKIKFKEVVNYFDYQNENASHVTMHKTKGTGIDNVLVVLDEYSWAEYDFKSIYCQKDKSDEKYLKKKIQSQKLFYVACSRAKSNLKCVRIIEDKNEESEMKKHFSLTNVKMEKIEL